MLSFFHKSDSLLSASRAEQSEAIEKLIAATTLHKGYYLLLTLSVLVTTLGLLVNNTAVIIGGMVLAPVLTPVLLLSLSLVMRSLGGILHSLKVLLLSLTIILGLSAGLTVALELTAISVQWIPQQIDAGIYFLIAFFSGIAAAFAWVKKDLSPTIAAIAITVSLLPPLCATGIAIALRNMQLAENSAQLFIANVVGIQLAAAIVFSLLGFDPLNRDDVAIAQEKPAA